MLRVRCYVSTINVVRSLDVRGSHNSVTVTAVGWSMRQRSLEKELSE